MPTCSGRLADTKKAACRKFNERNTPLRGRDGRAGDPSKCNVFTINVASVFDVN